MKKSACSRAELVDAIRLSREAGFNLLPEMARMLGFVHKAATPPEVRESARRASDDAVQRDIAIAPPVRAPSKTQPSTPVPFWMPVRYSRAERNEYTNDEVRELALGQTRWKGGPKEAPKFRPLASRAKLLTSLRRFVAYVEKSGRLDARRAVEKISRGETLQRMPMLQRLRWGGSIQVISDRSQHLIPFWQDQTLVTEWLRALFPRTSYWPARGYDPGHYHSGKAEAADDDGWLDSVGPDGEATDYEMPADGTLVLALSDLGCLAEGGAQAVLCWGRFGQRLREAGCRTVALSPGTPSREQQNILRGWQIIPWETGIPQPGFQADSALKDFERLLRLLSPALRIEPGLLRTLRTELTPALGPESETALWQHPAMEGRLATAGFLAPDTAISLRKEFEDREPDAARKRVLSIIREWRHRAAAEVFFCELMNLTPASRRLLPRSDTAQAREFFRSFADAAANDISGKTTAVLPREQVVWAAKVARDASSPAINDAKAGSAFREFEAVAERIENGEEIGTSHYFGSSAVRPWTLWQVGPSFAARPAGKEGEPQVGSLIGSISSASAINVVPLPSFWKGKAATWAHRWGEDDFGPWASFCLGELEQRMRWIPPGRFSMGSPDQEAGRWDDEGPQHEVILRRGFWLFDTPCRQDLWEAVMGENPSYFVSPDRPVERVNWDQCQDFIKALNRQVPGLSCGLPTEAQWEYACRAGSKTATYAGDLQILGRYNAPLLHEITWYGGNSGVDFDLDSGLDTTDWEEKQFDHNRAGTRAVGLKSPNKWGLYDMLGNVWEWCRDWHGPYSGDQEADPEGPGGGAIRVVRGGSWFNPARLVRAACRLWYEPGIRDSDLGFRCALVQAGAEPRQGGRQAERRPQSSPGNSSAIWVDGSRRNCQVPASERLLMESPSSGESLELASITKPKWADAVGRDEYGLWTDLVVARPGDNEIRQRLRWIPPGSFLMGSPEDEGGRFDNEGPQREVIISRGFWLFDTPCPQDLWEAVMGENPSRFKGGDQPTETVSWEQCREFIQALSELTGGLNCRLPSEAEWEYAARAGTSGPYAGDLEEMAWYGDNSGDVRIKAAELLTSDDPSEYLDKLEANNNQTHPVAEKKPSGWGLYDMHGNVWEWVQDWYDQDYYQGRPDPDVDPQGPEDGAFRVIRGGSWYDPARLVRAACRNWDEPGLRFNNLGFRCALAQGKAESRLEQSIAPTAPGGRQIPRRPVCE